MARTNSFLATAISALYTGAGTNYIVKTLAGAYYAIYTDSASDVSYRKSTDGGKTWGDPVAVFAGTATNLAIWYDRWSNISAGLIHLAYTESATDDTLYRTIDTESADALSTQTVIFAGASTATGGALSITRSRGGNVYCKTMIDAGVEGGFFRLTNANVPNGAWASRTDTEALATTDQWILVPGFAADNNDIMCIFWDASADEISRYIHDDSANTWAETSISATMVDVAATATFPHFAAAVDLTNSQILVVAWNGVDTALQDLLGWKVTESAITAFATTPVLNATDDCGCAAIAIDTDTEDWYVYYWGKSDGSETWATGVTLNYKKSTDDGATWGSETAMSTTISFIATNCLFCTPRFSTRGGVMWMSGSPHVFVSVEETITVQPTYALGI